MSSSPRAARHISKTSGMDLVNAAEAVRETMQTPGWAHLAEMLHAEHEALMSRLNAAEALSHDDYVLMHGQVRGLTFVELAAETLQAKAETWLAEQRAKHDNSDAPGAS